MNNTVARTERVVCFAMIEPSAPRERFVLNRCYIGSEITSSVYTTLVRSRRYAARCVRSERCHTEWDNGSYSKLFGSICMVYLSLEYDIFYILSIHPPYTPVRMGLTLNLNGNLFKRMLYMIHYQQPVSFSWYKIELLISFVFKNNIGCGIY